MKARFGFNYMGIGSDTHHLELGAAATVLYVFSSVDSAAAMTFSPIVGYRLQPKSGGFNLRAGVSPIIGAVGEGVVDAGFLPWPYVSNSLAHRRAARPRESFLLEESRGFQRTVAQ